VAQKSIRRTWPASCLIVVLPSVMTLFTFSMSDIFEPTPMPAQILIATSTPSNAFSSSAVIVLASSASSEEHLPSILTLDDSYI